MITLEALIIFPTLYCDEYHAYLAELQRDDNHELFWKMSYRTFTVKGNGIGTLEEWRRTAETLGLYFVDRSDVKNYNHYGVLFQEGDI